MRTGPRTVPAAYAPSDSEAGYINDPRRYPYFRYKNRNRSRPKLERLHNNQLITNLVNSWNGYVQSVRDDWNTAATIWNLTGWQLFTKCNTQRLKYGQPITSSVSSLHNSWASQHFATGGAIAGDLWQTHHPTYNIIQRVPGHKSLTELVSVDEGRPSSLTFRVSIQHNLFPSGPTQQFIAGFFVVTRPAGNAEFYFHDVDIVQDNSWHQIEVTADMPPDPWLYYQCRVAFYGYTGLLHTDNWQIEHSGKRWEFDGQMDNMFGDSMKVPGVGQYKNYSYASGAARAIPEPTFLF